jgi:DNA polymerase-3 subunit epsilon
MPDGTRQAYQTLVNPGMPIPPEATAVHGITDGCGRCAPDLGSIVAAIVDETWQGCDLAGFNLPAVRCAVPGGRASSVWAHAWDTASLRVVDVQRIFHKMEPRNLSAAAEVLLWIANTQERTMPSPMWKRRPMYCWPSWNATANCLN